MLHWERIRFLIINLFPSNFVIPTFLLLQRPVRLMLWAIWCLSLRIHRLRLLTCQLLSLHQTTELELIKRLGPIPFPRSTRIIRVLHISPFLSCPSSLSSTMLLLIVSVLMLGWELNFISCKTSLFVLIHVMFFGTLQAVTSSTNNHVGHGAFVKELNLASSLVGPMHVFQMDGTQHSC